jgi:hydrogenase nickel incorporation protein HypA/HybF
MALAESVLEIVERTARSHGAKRVRTVRLEIGVMAQVEIEAMEFAFEVVQRGSVAEGAALVVTEVPGTAWCMQCSDSIPIAARGDGCPCCGSAQLQVTGGDRMRVADIEIE